MTIALKSIPYPCPSSLLVDLEVESIHAVANTVTRHPLVGIISSLRSAFDDDCPVTKVYLEPLVFVVVLGNPRTVFGATAHGI